MVTASRVLWLFIVVVGCRREEAPAPSPSASARVAPVPSAAPKPWYEGTWTGSYEAELHRLPSDPGAAREWKKDEGTTATGKGSINLSVDAEGRATGEAEGPLGALGVSGSVDGESLRLSFGPRSGGSATDFRGVLVALREGEALRGTLRASSGDSLTARSAKVELGRAAGAP